jgi:hypothetical protein
VPNRPKVMEFVSPSHKLIKSTRSATYNSTHSRQEVTNVSVVSTNSAATPLTKPTLQSANADLLKLYKLIDPSLVNLKELPHL